MRGLIPDSLKLYLARLKMSNALKRNLAETALIVLSKHVF